MRLAFPNFGASSVTDIVMQRSWLGWLLAGFLFCSNVPSFGQFYGNGGMRRPGMGGMGTLSQQPDFKPTVPNIAGDLAARETKWLKENLNLTKEQGKAVKDLNADYGRQQQEAIKEILGKGGGRPTDEQTKQIRDAMMMYNEEKEDKLKQLLTPEQWVTYQTRKDDLQREIGGIRPPAPKEFQVKRDSLRKE